MWVILCGWCRYLAHGVRGLVLALCVVDVHERAWETVHHMCIDVALSQGTLPNVQWRPHTVGTDEFSILKRYSAVVELFLPYQKKRGAPLLDQTRLLIEGTEAYLGSPCSHQVAPKKMCGASSEACSPCLPLLVPAYNPVEPAHFRN